MKKMLIVTLTLFCVLNLQTTAAAAVPIESSAQYEAQISFFKEALDQFGAAEPDQAVSLWVKGDETRNGVYKYAVGSDKVKQWLMGKWGKPEKNFWIIGVSSPWLSRYVITDRKLISPSEIRYTVTYFWQTSAGPESPTVEHLTVTKVKDNWCVSKVNSATGLMHE